MLKIQSAALLSVILLSASGCPQREVSRVSPVQAKEQEKRIPVEINRDLDILFVIDNSHSMQQEQDSLAANFPQFIELLQTIEGGLPNVHIGVVSTNVGANTAIANCEAPNGDNGNLQVTPRVMGCTPPGPDPFIIDVENIDPMMPRETNYTGTLAETFSCIALLGTQGCGFEQPLESMMRALNNNPNNEGFLRPNAFLAVIFIADEDDCSASNFDIFSNNPADVPALGPLSSYRCFEFGVQCTPDSRDQVGLRDDCVPRENSPYIYSVQRYVDFLKSLKADPGLLIVAAVTGVSGSTNLPEPVSVGTAENGNPALVPVCESSGLGKADPSVRLKAFLDAFPGRNTVTTICQNDLSTALQQVAELLIEVVGNPCLEGDIKLDANGVPLCTVTDVLTTLEGGREETVVKKCSSISNAVAEAPCWYVEESPDCMSASYPTHLALTVERNGATVPIGTAVEVRCESN